MTHHRKINPPIEIRNIRETNNRLTPSTANEMIIEGDHNKGEPGDDAMYCEGKCDTWIHRKCAGLSKQQYEALTEEDAPYISPHCTGADLGFIKGGG